MNDIFDWMLPQEDSDGIFHNPVVRVVWNAFTFTIISIYLYNSTPLLDSWWENKILELLYNSYFRLYKTKSRCIFLLQDGAFRRKMLKLAQAENQTTMSIVTVYAAQDAHNLVALCPTKDHNCFLYFHINQREIWDTIRTSYFSVLLVLITKTL